MEQKISTCIICKNEASKITLALDSLAWCSDIVVVDSGSTDGTVELAQNHPTRPRVLHRAWEGYSIQREYAVKECRHDLVLMLDADEECSPELQSELENLRDDPRTAIWKMPRKNFLATRYVRCWSPDYQGRLIHRQRLVWDTRSMPEIRRPKEGFATARLRGALLHNRLAPYSPEDLNDGVIMAERAAGLADHMSRQGQKAGWSNLTIRPLATFLKYFIFKGAFLDGRFGLIIAYKTTIGVLLKYSVLYGQQELEKHSP